MPPKFKPTVFPYDFETKGIEDRPKYPPEPVGVALRAPGEKRGRYYAWGHASDNNCTPEQGRRALGEALAKGIPVCHNGKFDHDVADTHLGLPLPADHKSYEETEFLAFLADPYSPSLSLKPLAERYLGKEHVARDELRDWILANVPECKGKPKTWRGWAGYIWRAPGSLVGRYAGDDVSDTIGLYHHLIPEIKRRGMYTAYEREKRLMPILLRAEREGIRLDVERLRADGNTWLDGIKVVEDWLRKKLKTPLLDLDKNDELADALERAGAVKRWIMTAPSKTYPQGQRSTAWDNLLPVIVDPALGAGLRYRARLVDVVRIAIQNDDGHPWVERLNGDVLHTQWHQVRHSDERSKGFKGARTGRLSSAPNFQNLTSEPAKLTAQLKAQLPKELARQLPDLPNLRRYVRPRYDDHVLLGGDYNQQEARWLAHFAEGPLAELYCADPKADIHTHGQREVGRILRRDFMDDSGRKKIKNTGFGVIYGIGDKHLAEMMGATRQEAKDIRAAYYQALPGLEELVEAVQDRGRDGGAIRTWGGRQYFCEPAGWSKKHGREMTFEYKLLNYLIQGSSADQTKEATIQADEQIHDESRLQLLVHDELVFSVPKALAAEEARRLKTIMEGVRGDVPMRVDFESSATNWADMQELKL